MDEQARTDGPKTIVVTGATDGIGRALAFRLATEGHHLVLLARNPEKAARVRDEIVRTSGNEGVEWIHCDLSSLGSVRGAAAAVAQKHPRVDVLVNNAAIFGQGYEETEDGLESHLAVNYLAPFLLTHLLLDPLRAAGRARIVNVSGETARIACIALGDLGRKRRFGVLGAYGQSKLAMILFTRTLAERLGPAITANALHPGAVATSHVSAGPRWIARIWDRLVRGRGPDAAAAAVGRLATSPDVAGATGRYYFGTLRVPAPVPAYRRALRDALYTQSATLVGLPNQLPAATS